MPTRPIQSGNLHNPTPPTQPITRPGTRKMPAAKVPDTGGAGGAYAQFMVQRTVVLTDTTIRLRPDKWQEPVKPPGGAELLTDTRAGRKKRRKMQKQALGGCYFLGFRCFKGRSKKRSAKVEQSDVDGGADGAGGGGAGAGLEDDGEKNKKSVRSAQQERQQLLLVIACAGGRYKAATALIDENGCPPNEPDEEGEYPMTAAVRTSVLKRDECRTPHERRPLASGMRDPLRSESTRRQPHPHVSHTLRRPRRARTA